jgi:hypothetical protein
MRVRGARGLRTASAKVAGGHMHDRHEVTAHASRLSRWWRDMDFTDASVRGAEAAHSPARQTPSRARSVRVESAKLEAISVYAMLVHSPDAGGSDVAPDRGQA